MVMLIAAKKFDFNDGYHQNRARFSIAKWCASPISPELTTR